MITPHAKVLLRRNRSDGYFAGDIGVGEEGGSENLYVAPCCPLDTGI